jgi:hypothetical protein
MADGTTGRDFNAMSLLHGRSVRRMGVDLYSSPSRAKHRSTLTHMPNGTRNRTGSFSISGLLLILRASCSSCCLHLPFALFNCLIKSPSGIALFGSTPILYHRCGHPVNGQNELFLYCPFATNCTMCYNMRRREGDRPAGEVGNCDKIVHVSFFHNKT